MKSPTDSWITPDPVAVDGTDRLITVLEKMAGKGVGAVPVLEGGRLAGIFTERDLLRLFPLHSGQDLGALLDRPVRDFMTPNPVCADASDDFSVVLMKMKVHNVRHIPVLDGARLAGIISMRDLLRYYQNRLEAEVNETRIEMEDLKKTLGVVENERLDALLTELQRYRELSLTDYLTGLYNKRYFQARIAEEVVRARRYGEQLSLIFCDIDFFKRINDLYGHLRGDEVLKEIACLLSGTVDELHVVSRLRKSDIVARYGGEEFVIILPETGRTGAIVAAEKLRRSIEEHAFRADDREVRLTMSFGVAELSPDDADHNEIIRNADYAMYVAKKSGRNRVAAHPVELPVEKSPPPRTPRS